MTFISLSNTLTIVPGGDPGGTAVNGVVKGKRTSRNREMIVEMMSIKE
jgi:hypothetical protein